MATMELVSMCEDFWMEMVGGAMSGIDIWTTCIVPSLLNNASTWMEIDNDTIKELDDLQSMFVWSLLKLPKSTPLPASFGKGNKGG